ncbi:MAG: hypothetical protein B6D61_05840 [Bacteroidetes bacterium 4484_249]|nr:MAG: hypothetical protein B6D61_05840 [Bacteroidetes bacterium 4484_249]
MKTQILKNTILTLALSISMFFVQSQNCTQCDNTGNPTGTYASEVGQNTTASGDYSFAGGINSTASGAASFAFGNSAQAMNHHSFALGGLATAENSGSFALGSFCTASGTNSFVLGYGQNSSTILENQIGYSLMIGINSDKPTFFVGESTGAGTTGRIGIGDVTDPQAKLHIKADDNEQAVLFIEPHTFSAANNAFLWMGTPDYGLRAGYHKLYFITDGQYIFNSADANVGIGTINPLAKLQISDGDIFIEDIDRGIIMKSPDGQCWRGTLDNNGSLNFEIIDCSLVTSAETNEANSIVNIYPNPSKGYLTVKVSGNNRNLTVQLFDMTGNLIIARNTHNAKTVIKTKGLPSGNYIIKVSDKEGNLIQSEKITIL